jgi:hypothetical protein
MANANPSQHGCLEQPHPGAAQAAGIEFGAIFVHWYSMSSRTAYVGYRGRVEFH